MRKGTVLVLWLMVVVYTFLGGVMFMYLEGGARTDKDIPLNLTTYLEGHWNATSNDADVKTLVRDAIAAYKQGTLVLEEAALQRNKWTFGASAFFSITVTTTIGYGNFAPVTRSGRVVCIIYALLGIPLNVVLLAAIGRRVNSCFRRIDRHVSSRFPHPRVAQTVRVVLTFLLGWVIFIQLPALAFTYMEGWTTQESIYMAFITLSTIGFGDLSPEVYMYENSLARLLTFIWLYLGLAWLSTMLSVMEEIISHKVLPPSRASDVTDAQISNGAAEKEKMAQNEEV